VTAAPAEVELPPVFRTGSRRRVRLLAPLVTNRTARLGVALLALLLAAAIVGPLVAPGNGSIVAMLGARQRSRSASRSAAFPRSRRSSATPAAAGSCSRPP
jgi:hypothetical protein